MEIRIEGWDWGLRIGIGDWGLGIGDWGFGIKDWDWGMGMGIGIGIWHLAFNLS